MLGPPVPGTPVLGPQPAELVPSHSGSKAGRSATLRSWHGGPSTGGPGAAVLGIPRILGKVTKVRKVRKVNCYRHYGYSSY